MLDARSGTIGNASYFPILVGADYPLSRDDLYEVLKEHDIYARRYFYPLISEFSMYRNLPSARRTSLPNASRIAAEVITLPLYPALGLNDVNRVIDVIVGNIKSA